MDLTSIQSYRGSGTSMISLIVPPSTNLADLRQKMLCEYQTARNIKDNVNRKSVQQALVKLNEVLKTIQMPPMGFALFTEQYI